MLLGSWFFLSDCDMSSGLLTNWTNSLTNHKQPCTHFHFFTAATGVFCLVVILLQFVLYCCYVVDIFPIWTSMTNWRWSYSAVHFYPTAPFRLLPFNFVDSFPLLLKTPVLMYIMFYLIFLLSPLISFYPFFKCLSLSSVVFLFLPPLRSIILLMHGTHLMPW